MYVYESAITLTNSISGQWQETDVSDMSFSQIYTLYKQTYLTVRHVQLDQVQYVPLNAYKNIFGTSSLTVNQWMSSLGNTALQTVPELPTENLTHARYANAILARYKFMPAKAGLAYPANMPLSELTDVIVTRPQFPTDMETVYKHCMVKVNGYYHRTAWDGDNLYIIDAAKTSGKKPCSHTGFVSFLDIGEIQYYSITDEDILPLMENAPLKEGLLIKLPEVAAGKSIIFVLGGYLIQPEPAVWYATSDTAWSLNIKGLPYFERLFESRKEIDLSSVPMEGIDTNPEDTLVQESLLTDETIRAYLKISQSFLVIVDTPDLYMSRIHVRVSNLPGLITSYQDPEYPLVMGYGKHVEYSKVKETDYWALRVADAAYKQYVFNTAPSKNMPVLADYAASWKPYLRTDGYLLKIQGKKKPR